MGVYVFNPYPVYIFYCDSIDISMTQRYLCKYVRKPQWPTLL